MSMRFWKPNQYAIFLDPNYDYPDELPPGPLLIIADTDAKTYKWCLCLDDEFSTKFLDILVVRPKDNLIIYTTK